MDNLDFGMRTADDFKNHLLFYIILSSSSCIFQNMIGVACNWPKGIFYGFILRIFWILLAVAEINYSFKADPQVISNLFKTML
jgi:hypothetical protein